MKILFTTFLTAIFFLSGFAGLVYEIVWIREFSFILGNSVYTVSVVLAAFMAGLGLGGWAAARWGRLAHSPLLAYAALEMGTGMAGLLLYYMFRWFLRGLGPVGVVDNEHILPFLERFVLSFIAMGIPTAMMGATLPFLVLHQNPEGEKSGITVGALYGANTLGAAAGCFVTGFFLIRLLGTENATRIAAILNILAAALASLLARLAPATEAPPAAPLAAPASDTETRRGTEWTAPYRHGTAGFLLVALTISGATSMAYELLYFRLLSYIVGNRIYASTAMITVFLLGMGAGSALAGRVIDRVRREVAVFSLLQVLIGLSAFVVAAYFQDIIGFSRYLEMGMKPDAPWQFVRIRMLEAAAIMSVPALAFGAMFPCVIRYIGRGPVGVSPASGLAYAFNTAGCVIGALVTGFVAIPMMGTINAMLAAAAVSVLLGHRILAVDWESASLRRRAGAILASSALAALAAGYALRHSEYPWARPGLRRIFAREEPAALVTAYTGPLGLYMFGDDTELSFPVGPSTPAATVQKLQAVIPILLHPDPRRVLVVGMGFGIASGAFSMYGGLEPVETVELLEGVIAADTLFREYNHDMIKSPKSKIIAGDGRYYLAHAKRPYDIIASNVCGPDLPGSASLYTKEFFELAREKLAPNGLFVLHVFGRNRDVIMKTLGEVFPYVRGYRAYSHSMHLVASLKPVIPDKAVAERHLKAWQTFRGEAADCGISSLADLEKRLAMTEKAFKDAIADPDIPINTDERPVLEYSFQGAGGDPFQSRLASATPPALITSVITAVGDVLVYDRRMDGAYGAVSRKNPDDPGAVYRYPFTRISSLLRGVVFGNLVGPLADVPPRIALDEDAASRRSQPARFITALKEGGFTIMSLANDRIKDRGRQGLVETTLVLRKAGIRPVGAGEDVAEARAPVAILDNGIHIAFLAYNLVGPADVWAGPDEAGTANADRAGILADVRAARQKADAVVVALRWAPRNAGDGTAPAEPAPGQVSLARAAVDAGAAAIIGSYSRAIGRVERWNRGYILYGLGNINLGDGRGRSMIARITIDGNGKAVRLRLIPINSDPAEAKYSPFPLGGAEKAGFMRVFGQY